MHFKIFNTLLISSLAITSLQGSDILSSEQIKSLSLAEDQAMKEAKIEKYNWIRSLTYRYSYSDNELSGYSKSSAISIDQPIFKSGGIYQTLKYGDFLKDSSKLSFHIQRNQLIQQAYNIAFNYQKTQLQIAQQKLAIDNAAIDLKVKKESVLNGLLDTSFLNNAIITLNQQKAKMLEYQYTKNSLISNFSNLSDSKIDSVQLPTLIQIGEKEYSTNHMELQKTNLDIEAKKSFNWKTIANSGYLPSVNVNYSKTFYHSDTTSFKDGDTNDIMGISLVVPFDFNALDTIEASKIEYMKEKNDLKILEKQEINFFKSQNLKIDMIEDKVDLTKENINSYTELLVQMEELANAGLKTKDDVTILANSKKSEELYLEILEYEKQIELLEIYGKLNSDKI